MKPLLRLRPYLVRYKKTLLLGILTVPQGLRASCVHRDVFRESLATLRGEPSGNGGIVTGGVRIHLFREPPPHDGDLLRGRLLDGALLLGVVRVGRRQQWTAAAWSLYKFSLVYLALLFGAMVADRLLLR